MNRTIIIGRVTRDIELRYTPSEKAVTQFTVAVNRRNNDEADFISCEAWNKTAEVMSKYVKRGDRIGIVGHLKVDSYEKDGQKRTFTKVVVDELEFLANKRKEEPPQKKIEFEDISDDDIHIGG